MKEVWEKHGGKVNEHIDAVDRILGSVEIRYNASPKFLLLYAGRAVDEEGKHIIELHPILKLSLLKKARLSVIAHELGEHFARKIDMQEIAKRFGTDPGVLEHYVGCIFERLLLEEKLPDAKKSMGISPTLLPTKAREQVLEKIKKYLQQSSAGARSSAW